jgi:succinate-semialdehyde dehydrogenase/glutarate-semialdehyde dehydrogenase
MRALRVGDPLDERTQVGPVATAQGRAELHDLVADALAGGAKALCGGAPVEGPGWFYPPTVLAGVTPAMRIHREEAFGPVATLYRAPDLDAAIALANDTPFGLSANAWTADPDEQRRLVAELDAGGVFVNGMTTSYPELPFGGVKRSGYGRELSAIGIREFCNVKAVWMA